MVKWGMIRKTFSTFIPGDVDQVIYKLPEYLAVSIFVGLATLPRVVLFSRPK